ncbi:MAG: TldD/PmbA family protein [Caldisphaera sp.]|nr:MAG: TldD/PmbA family protein [Caldisphaera sp.]PMP89635.1 MAG: TldD/PmbA family protein [Caldisphaera sp.]
MDNRENNVDKILKNLSSKNIEAEIFHVKVRFYELSIEKGEQHGLINEESGYGLRIINDKRLGFAYGNTLNDELIDLAISSSNANERDDANYLPGPQKLYKLEGIYDESLLNPIENLKSYLNDINSIKDKVNIINSKAVGGVAEVEIKNTQGIDVSEKNSFIWVGIIANYLGNEVTPEIYEGMGSKSVKKINIDKIIKSILEKTEIMKNRRKINKKFDYIIFTQKAIDELVVPLLNYGFSLENSYRNRTPFKLNDFLESKISITDDPLIPYFSWSREFDGEGLPSKRVEIIRDGVIKSYLSNSYWAKKANYENTHSAFRTYTSLPSISTTTLVFSGKNFSDNNAVYVDQLQGVHTSNFDTGDFSVSANVAWDNDGGFREILISGNIKELLNNIIGFDNDLIQYNKVFSGKMMVKGLSIA